jgi:hypothetical protein
MPTRSTKPARWLAALSAAALILSLNACTKDDDGLPDVSEGLPSVDGGTPSTGGVESEDDLEKVAQALHDCLSDADLPVRYASTSDGRSILVEFDDNASAIWITAEGAIHETPAVSQAERDAFDSQLKQGGKADPKPILLVAGVDHSETWARCLDSSGYDENAALGSVDNSAMVDAYNQLVVDVSNEWAKCARENGHPNVIDAHLPQDDRDSPIVLLPASITEDPLRQLLAACPTFDPAVEEANNKLMEEQTGGLGGLPDGYRPGISIGFDFPGFDAIRYSDVDQTSLSPEAAATSERLSKLLNLIYEAQMEHSGMPGASAMPGGGFVSTFPEGWVAPAADPTETPS